MGFIDADTHVFETEQTWDYLDPSERGFRPLAVTTTDSISAKTFWLVDGELLSRAAPQAREGAIQNILVPEGARFLTDVDARLRQMDEFGVEIQVIFPSLFLLAQIQRPEVEVALCKSYNRWLADIWAESKGRLRWAVVPPLQSMDHALAQVEFGKQHGACAVFMRGAERNRVLSDRYFYPLYQKANDLELAIGIHVGNTSAALRSAIFAVIPIIGGFHSRLLSDVADRFPKLRVGFLEAGSSWLPFALQEAARGTAAGMRKDGRIETETLRDHRMFVACQVDDDLPYILQYAGEDNLVLGSDYAHADLGSDLEAHRLLSQRGDVSPVIVNKIVDANARRLYGL